MKSYLYHKIEVTHLVGVLVAFHAQEIVAHGIICPLMNDWSNLCDLQFLRKALHLLSEETFKTQGR